MTSARTRGAGNTEGGASDPLMVRSVEKAFRVLQAFDQTHQSLSLAQLAQVVDLDKSAAQRFTHTLVKLGYLRKDPGTKRFELTLKALDLARHFISANEVVGRAMPYLLHLSRTTEETVNLTLPDDTEIVFAARFMSRHMLGTDVVVGTRMPAFCTAPGRAILSRLPKDKAMAILARSTLRAFTAHTIFQPEALEQKLDRARELGYATAWDEFFPGDLSVASAILDRAGQPIAAVNIGVSRARFTPERAEEILAPLVVAAAGSISQAVPSAA